MQGGDRVMDRLTKLFILSLIINTSEKICFVTCILMLAFGVVHFVTKDVFSYNMTMSDAIACTVTGIVRLLSECIFLRVYDSKEDN